LLLEKFVDYNKQFLTTVVDFIKVGHCVTHPAHSNLGENGIILSIMCKCMMPN
jgi:hypothetical protein